MPTSWKKRRCTSCGMTFKSMTDNVWKNVQRTHKRSLGHKKRLKRKSQ